MKNLMKFSCLFALVFSGLFFTSCSDENDLVSDLTDTYTEEALFTIESRTNTGRLGCFEFIFPITIEMPDATTQTVMSLEELKEVIQTFKENNPDAEEKPTLVYPIEVLSEDGEIISVESQDGLKELKKACNYRGNGSRGHKTRDLCFEINYPLTVVFPDGTTAEAETRREIKQLARAYKEANPDAEEKPMVQFPIEVTLEDETVISVASKEELKALKENCE